MRPDAFFSLFFLSFFFTLVSSLSLSLFFSIKHIWLRAVGGFGFLIHSDFLVEVVVVLRAVGGGCGFLGLPLVVVELDFGVAGFEEQKMLGHMCFSCYRTYVMILCNWLIL